MQNGFYGLSEDKVYSINEKCIWYLWLYFLNFELILVPLNYIFIATSTAESVIKPSIFLTNITYVILLSADSSAAF